MGRATVVRTSAEPTARDERRRRTAGAGAAGRPGLVGFLAPFVVLFRLFYLVPIGYAVVESLYTVTRERRHVRRGPPRCAAGSTSTRRCFVRRRVLGEHPPGAGVLRDPGAAAARHGAGVRAAARLAGAPRPRFFRLAFFVPYAVPGVIAAIMWGFLYAPSCRRFTLRTAVVRPARPGLVIFSIANIVNWVFTGYNMLIIYAALQAIPPELTEAARIDGAGQWRIAWSVKIPMVAPALGLTGVFSIIGTLQLFNEPLVMRSVSSAVGSDYTPNMVVYSTSNIPNYNLAAAFSVVLALVTCVLSFTFLKFAQRRTVS